MSLHAGQAKKEIASTNNYSKNYFGKGSWYFSSSDGVGSLKGDKKRLYKTYECIQCIPTSILVKE